MGAIRKIWIPLIEDVEDIQNIEDIQRITIKVGWGKVHFACQVQELQS